MKLSPLSIWDPGKRFIAFSCSACVNGICLFKWPAGGSFDRWVCNYVKFFAKSHLCIISSRKTSLALLLFQPVLQGSVKCYRKDSIRVKFEYSQSEKKLLWCTIFSIWACACQSEPSCLHKQMKLTSVHSIGSFYTSHFISIIPLSITLREGWNLSLVDESERIQQILFGLYPAAKVLVISPTARKGDQSERLLLLLWRSWVVSFMSKSSIQFQSDGFLFEALWKLCVKVHILKYRHPAKLRKLLPRWNCLFVCCASKKCFSSVVCRGICENVVDFNQRWRPFILWMLWLQHVWLCVDCRSEKMQVARRVLQPSRAFALEQEFLAKTANYREYLRGFLCKRPHCE